MTTLPELLDTELARQGIDPAALAEGDLQFAQAAIRSFVVRLKARITWESHIGGLLSHAQVLDLTGWTKQALSQAVRDGRVLRLEADTGHAYLLAGFDDAEPARPLPGIKQALRPFVASDPHGWVTASWLMSRQPELGGQTPRDALLAGCGDQVAALATHAAARLAA
jgi:hypothetical protein